MRFVELDMDSPYVPADLERSFDLIIASNCVQATRGLVS